MHATFNTWVYLYTHEKPEDAPAMAEPISLHGLATLSFYPLYIAEVCGDI